MTPGQHLPLIVWILISTGSLAEAVERPCDGPDYRAFDFAIGAWSITSDSGQDLGSIEVKSVLNGCAIEEYWNAPGHITGKSLNALFEDTRVWRQLYSDDSGRSLFLEGMATGRAIVLNTQHGAAADAFFRYSWAPQPDGTIVQSGEHCANGEVGCKPLFSNRWTRLPPGKGQ